jgi:hypothetical protein
LLDHKLAVEPPTICELESFAEKSFSGEWVEEGKRLLTHREFEEAILAFDNAGDVYMAAVAEAYRSQEVARGIPKSQKKRRRRTFVNTASAIERCAEMAKSDKDKTAHYGAAAQCYAEISYHRDAVRALKLANMLTEAASYCSQYNILDTAVSVIKRPEVEVDSQTTDFIEEAREVPEVSAVPEVAQLSCLESEQPE